MATKTATVNLFAAAKKTETKTAASTKPKEKVFISGIEADLIRYEEIKKLEANTKAEKEMIAGRLKEIARTEFLKKYNTQKSRPDSFLLADGEGKIMVIVMDAYKKVEEAKEAALQAYEDVLETKTTYTINPDLLDKCGEAISKAIMAAKGISDEDKANIILCTEKTEVKKGTIDRLLQYQNADQLFYMIEPTVALK